MTERKALTMPALVLLEDFGGNFAQYLEAVYAYFQTRFRGLKTDVGRQTLRLKKISHGIW